MNLSNEKMMTRLRFKLCLYHRLRNRRQKLQADFNVNGVVNHLADVVCHAVLAFYYLCVFPVRLSSRFPHFISSIDD
jgi:hypothetical protein